MNKKTTQSLHFHLLESGSKRIKITGFSLIILNLSFAVRFLVTIRNGMSTFSSRSDYVLLILSLLAIGLSYLAIKSRMIIQITAYFQKKRSVFELFIWFLASRQLVSWLVNRLDTPAALEISGWYVTLCLWTVINLAGNAFSFHFGDIFRQRNTVSPFKRYTPQRKVFTVGVILILLTICGYWLYTQILAPLPYYVDYDPEFSYFLNSLMPFKNLELYKYMDHPGTLIQLIGSMFHVVVSSLNISDSGSPLLIHFAHPEYYLFLASIFLLVINIWAAVALTKYVIKIENWADVLGGLSIVLVYFAAHPVSLDFLAIWSPNSFNLSFGTPVLIVLFLMLNSSDEVDEKQSNALSTAAGIVATFHMYMIIWIIGIAATIFFYYQLKHDNIIGSLKKAGISFFHSIKGYLIGTLTIIYQFESIIDWIKDIIIHQDLYGTGERGITSLTKLSNNFIQMFNETVELFILSGLVIGIVTVLMCFFRKNIRGQEGNWAITFGLTIQLLVLFALVIKHPRSRYLLSVAATLPILLAAIYHIIKQQTKASYISSSILLIIIIAGFGTNIIRSVTRHQNRTSYYQSYNMEITNFLENHADAQDLTMEDLSLYWTYSTYYSPCFSLWFGNDWAKGIFSNEISSVCNSNYSLNIWSGRIMPPEADFQNNTLDQRSVIIGDPERLEKYGFGKFGSIIPSKFNNLGFIIPGK